MKTAELLEGATNLDSLHEPPKAVRILVPGGTKICTGQFMVRMRDFEIVEASHEPRSAAVPAASCGGVSPQARTLGGTPGEPAGEDACATSATQFMASMRDFEIMETLHEPPESPQGVGVRWLAGNGADAALELMVRVQAKAVCALAPHPPHSKTLARDAVHGPNAGAVGQDSAKLEFRAAAGRISALAVVALLALSPTVLTAAETQVLPLWPKGAPGFEDRRHEPEQAKEYWVRNIHNPSITVFLPPKEKANGAAVLIVPGGGHRELVFKAEGAEPAKFLNDLGVTAFVLKHRLARETNSPYSLQKHPREDAQRAMRLIRSRAAEWALDTHRIGVMGFSAGGEVVAMLVYSPTTGDTNAADAIDRVNCRADFQIVIYPGPVGIPDQIPEDVPPAFFLVANDDRGHVGPVISQLEKYRQARRPIEVHLYARGGHGFNMGNRSKLASIQGWPQRLADWMADNDILVPAPRPANERRE